MSRVLVFEKDIGTSMRSFKYEGEKIAEAEDGTWIKVRHGWRTKWLPKDGFMIQVADVKEENKK